MKFEIPFDKEIAEKHKNLLWHRRWNNFIRGTNRSLAYGITFTLLGVTFIYFGSNAGYFLCGGAVALLAIYLQQSQQIKKGKKEHLKYFEKEAADKSKPGFISLWEFDENFLRYRDEKYLIEIKWDVFHSWNVAGSTLFIHLNEAETQSYLLEENSVGTENFAAIKELLAKKIAKI